MLKIGKTWIIFTMVLWLICCQGLFVLVQRSFGDKIVQSAQSQFRQELDFSNFNFLARSITDSTTSESIRCAVLDKISPESIKVLDLRYMGKDCDVGEWSLKGSKFNTHLKSLNGDIYQFQFISNNPILFDLALWGFRILGLLAILGIMLAIKSMAEKKLIAYQAEVEIAQMMKAISMQVSHDIRSPLTALKMAIEDTSNLPVDQRLIIRSSIQRINDIANNLLRSGKKIDVESEANIELLAPLVDSLVSEKRLQFRHKTNIHIESDLSQSYGLFALVNSAELKRVLSNLINNSQEAMDDKNEQGIITVKISLTTDDRILLSIRDNGKGMPDHVLKKLGEKGFSFGKNNDVSGHGLGFAHAKQTIESFGGKLEVESTVDVGTTINLIFPKQKTPSWFVESIVLSRDKKVILLDDDESILQAWSERLPKKIKNFLNPEEFKQEVKQTSSKDFLILIDYELQGYNETGLDIIKSLHIEKNSILVTSHFDEAEVLEQCKALGVRLIPKMMMAFVPIDLLDEAKVEVEVEVIFDYVYIDDDQALRTGWERRAKKQKVNLLTLNSTREFKLHEERINRETTHIYIDSFLGEGEIKGEEFALFLYKEGYKNLFIASGYEKDHFAHLPWLGFAGKDCPF